MSEAKAFGVLRMERARAARSDRFRAGKLSRSDIATLVAAGNQNREIPKVTLPYVTIQHVEEPA